MNKIYIALLVRIIVLLLLLQTIGFDIHSQNLTKKFFKLPCAEKQWVLMHIFIAKNVYKISEETIIVTKSLLSDSTLDGDLAGGQLDAFRHAYWMALITYHYGVKTAMSLGKAHEKGNYQFYKKNKNEDGVLPDFESSQMDYLNNDVGIEIGKSIQVDDKKMLIDMIISYIKEGKLYVIKKNIQGLYLDCNKNILPINQKKWYSGKCIVSSNYKKE